MKLNIYILIKYDNKERHRNSFLSKDMKYFNLRLHTSFKSCFFNEPADNVNEHEHQDRNMSITAVENQPITADHRVTRN